LEKNGAGKIYPIENFIKGYAIAFREPIASDKDIKMGF